MPSATFAELPTLSPGKKRSRDENGELHLPMYVPCDWKDQHWRNFSSPHVHSFAHADNETHAQDKLGRLAFHNISNKRPASNFAGEVQRKILPLPSSKRVRVMDDADAHYGGYNDEIQRNNQAALSNYSTPPLSPQLQPQMASRQVPVKKQTLDPCHICHRKPTRKSDLDSFADCQGCGQRTCYVCIRQCQGWLPNNDSRRQRHSIFGAAQRQQQQQQHQPQQQQPDEEDDAPLSRSFTMHDVDDGEQEQWPPSSLYNVHGSSRQNPSHDHEPGWKGHASVICSRCCIERGSEGDVMCLGCLAGVEGA
jgi:hypothetical protein